jgi:hypothetical protein
MATYAPFHNLCTGPFPPLLLTGRRWNTGYTGSLPGKRSQLLHGSAAAGLPLLLPGAGSQLLLVEEGAAVLLVSLPYCCVCPLLA